MSTNNPVSCCGDNTGCCPPGTVIPDRLTVTMQTDCGTFTVPVSLVEFKIFEGGEPHWVWSNDNGEFECQFEPDDCQITSSIVTVRCSVSGWEIEIDSCPNSAQPSSWSCAPFLLQFNSFTCILPCNVTPDLTITVTE